LHNFFLFIGRFTVIKNECESGPEPLSENYQSVDDRKSLRGNTT
jgi:hypothetical protein